MRKINFNSGPSMLPLEVLQHAVEGILNINNEGISVAEISHRSKLFKNILEEFIALIKELANVHYSHEVLVMQGGARLQFAQIPMNFLSKEQTAAFIDTGYWANIAIEYAKYYGNTKIIASSKKDDYLSIPKEIFAEKELNYLQITSNNTIYGSQFKTLPNVDIPMVIDMSSDIFSIQRNFDKIDFAFACAQKNIGPSGMSIAIIKKDFLQKANKNIPPVFSFQNLVNHLSNYATPPVVNVYISLLNMRWLKAQGGVMEIENKNHEKAKILYDEIDRNSLFENKISTDNRSTMNVCFFAKDENIENKFLVFCNEQNIVGIKGHKAVGGLRASIYNAQRLDNVLFLVNTLKEFEEKNINN